jgi:hypothetical protein
MSDQEYDIAFSNSVIEHVGDWERQAAFASEIRRVGKNLWIQTPAKECPIEPHYLAPPDPLSAQKHSEKDDSMDYPMGSHSETHPSRNRQTGRDDTLAQ